MTLIRAIRERGGDDGDPSDEFASYTLLSTRLGSLAPNAPLMVMAPEKILVDLKMVDADVIGPINVHAGGEWRFDPRVDTRLVCHSLVIHDGWGRSDGQLDVSAHPTDLQIDLTGAAATVNGYTPAERTALGIGTGVIRGFTHTASDVPTGNDGNKNDSGGIPRSIQVMGTGKLQLFGKGPQVRRLNAHWTSGTVLTLDSPLTAAAPVGTVVLVTPTDRFNTSKRTEEKTLAVAANIGDTTITVNSGPAFPHWGRLQYATDLGVSLTPGRFTNGDTSSYTGSLAGGVLTITAVASGTITVGQRVRTRAYTTLLIDPHATKTYVTAQLTQTGAPGGIGTYSVDNAAASLASTNTLCLTGMRAHAFVQDTIDERAFVVICHSNVRIRAYDLGNTDLALKRFGWHGMAHDLTTDVQIQGIMGIDYGQHGLLGRYGWHWHFLSYNANGTIKTTGVAGSTPFSQTAAPAGPNFPPGKAVLKNCIFYRGHNRAGLLHGCRGAVMSENVFYKSFGHAFMEEDSSEEDNTVERNLAIRAEGAPEWATIPPLKYHEITEQYAGDAGPSGFWFGNPRNRHIDNWGVDCEGHGFWNGFAHKNNGGVGGCTGLSSQVPLFAFHIPLNTGTNDVWEGNTGFCCGIAGRTNMNPYNERGNGLDYGVQSTHDGTPTGTNIDSVFKRIGILKSGGRAQPNGRHSEAYHNRVNIGRYERPVTADNFGPAFNGQAQGGSSNEWALGFGYTLNNAEGVDLGVYAASYHGLMNFLNSSYFNFHSAAPFVTEPRIVKRSCVLDTWDLYTDPLHTWSVNMSNWRMLNSGGVYQSPGPQMLNDTTTYDAIFGSHQYEDYEVNTHDRHMVGIIYDHYGYFSEGPTKSGVPCAHIVYDQPFVMNGVTGTALEINPFSKVTTTPFFAHQQGYNTSMDTPMPWGIYPGNIAYSIDNALQWERLNASFVGTGAILAARDSHYQHDQGTDGVRFKNVAGGGVAPNHDELWSSIFNGNKFGFFPSGSIVKFTIPGAGNPGKTNTDYGFLRNASFWIVKVQQAYNARFANDVTDTVTMSFPVKGTRNVTSMANGGFTYTSSGTTKAEFDAATPADHKYWHDKPNNALYVKFDGKSHASYYMFSFTTT